MKVEVYYNHICVPSQQTVRYLKKNPLQAETEFIHIDSDPFRVKENGIVATPTILVKNKESLLQTLVGHSKEILNQLQNLER